MKRVKFDSASTINIAEAIIIVKIRRENDILVHIQGRPHKLNNHYSGKRKYVAKNIMFNSIQTKGRIAKTTLKLSMIH